MHEGVAQAVPAKRPDKEGWRQAEPWGAGWRGAHVHDQAPAHRGSWLWLWEGDQELAESGNGLREGHLPR